MGNSARGEISQSIESRLVFSKYHNGIVMFYLWISIVFQEMSVLKPSETGQEIEDTMRIQNEFLQSRPGQCLNLVAPLSRIDIVNSS